MKKRPKKVNVMFCASPTLVKVLRDQAKKERRSVSSLVRYVLSEKYRYYIEKIDLKVFDGKKWVRAPKKIVDAYEEANDMIRRGWNDQQRS